MFNKKDRYDTSAAAQAGAPGQPSNDASPRSAGQARPSPRPDAAGATQRAGTSEQTALQQSKAPSSGRRPSDLPGVDELFRQLDDEVNRVSDVDDGTGQLRRIATEASERADSLLAAASTQTEARKEAQKIIGAATRERDRAASQAAQLLAEARTAAARLQAEAESRAEEARADLGAWAAEQREVIDGVVTDLRDSAQQDADKLRADAQRQAMTQARRAARGYVARAAELATRESEAQREQAREVLERTGQAVAMTRATVQEFTDQLTSFMAAMGGHLDELEVVANLAASQAAAAEQSEPIDLGAQDWDIDEDAVAEAIAPVEDDDSQDATDETDAESAPDEPVPGSAAATEADELDEPATQADDEPVGDDSSPTTTYAGRPLGSLFRGAGLDSPPAPVKATRQREGN